jgi:hypothetical protein
MNWNNYISAVFALILWPELDILGSILYLKYLHLIINYYYTLESVLHLSYMRLIRKTLKRVTESTCSRAECIGRFNILYDLPLLTLLKSDKSYLRGDWLKASQLAVYLHM